MPAGGGDHAPDRFQELVLVLESHLGFGEDAAALDEHLVRAVDHDLADGAVVEEAVEGSVADRRAQDDVGERRLLGSAELDAVLGQEAVEVSAHRAREGEGVARREADVADEGEPVSKIVREPVEVATLPSRCFHDVAAAAERPGHVGGAVPCVDELHLQQRCGCGHRRDDPLPLGQADLDREPGAVA